MYRGTTPTLTFSLPFDTSMLAAVYITFTQAGATVVEKTIADVFVAGDTITCPLHQEDTLSLRAGIFVYIQIRVKFASGAVAASEIVPVLVEETLKDGVI